MDIDVVLRLLHIDYSIKDWQVEKDSYIKQTEMLSKPVLMINNITTTTHGGCYHFEQRQVINELSLGEKGVLIVEL